MSEFDYALNCLTATERIVTKLKERDRWRKLIVDQGFTEMIGLDGDVYISPSLIGLEAFIDLLISKIDDKEIK